MGNQVKSKTKKVSKTVITEDTDFDNTKPNRRVHIGFSIRLGFLMFCFCCFVFVAMFLIITAITFQNEEFINYSEKGSLDYRVKLKPNNYYDTDVLGKNMIYVASLIDSVETSFDYEFKIDEPVTMDFTYDIVAKLDITDESGENLYLTKNYTLLENKQISMNQGKYTKINEIIDVDYDYYNKIATGFKSTYGVNSKSNLYVMLNIKKHNEDKTTTILSKNSIQQVKIPLSERSVDIKIDTTSIDNDSILISEKDILINSTVKLIIGGVCVLFAIFYALRFIRLLEKTQSRTNKFDKYVNKILKTYDRLIVESRNTINLDNYETIKVSKFEELLDVRDNLKLPINYYVVTPHQKAIFYIISTNVYLYVLKEVDLDKK